jgi:membrane protease YdiL (CAAX protease family)
MQGFAKQHPIVTYYVLTYVLSWSVFIPLALKKHGVMQLPVPFSAYYVASYGPLLSALVTTWLIGGSEAVRELSGRMLRWRVRPMWWAAALSPLLLLAVTAVILRFVKGKWFDLGLLGQVEFLPDLGLGALVLWLFTYGIGEETGWRGFALPRLQRNRSALRATFLLWIFWALWHAPAFFLVYDPAILPGFLVGLFAGAIVFTWLYNSSNGSILIVAIFHGVFNFTTASKMSKAGLVSAIISTIVMVWAVLVVALYKPANLSPNEKHTL